MLGTCYVFHVRTLYVLLCKIVLISMVLSTCLIRVYTCLCTPCWLSWAWDILLHWTNDTAHISPYIPCCFLHISSECKYVQMQLQTGSRNATSSGQWYKPLVDIVHNMRTYLCKYHFVRVYQHVLYTYLLFSYGTWHIH